MNKVCWSEERRRALVERVRRSDPLNVRKHHIWRTIFSRFQVWCTTTSILLLLPLGTAYCHTPPKHLHQPLLVQSPKSMALLPAEEEEEAAASHAWRVHSSFPLAFIAPTRLAPTQASNDLSHANAADVSSSSCWTSGSRFGWSAFTVGPTRLAQLTIHILLLRPLNDVYRLSRCSNVRIDSVSRNGKPGSILPPPMMRMFEMNTLRRSMASCEQMMSAAAKNLSWIMYSLP